MGNRDPPNGSVCLTRGATKGGKDGGGTLTRHQAPTARSQGPEGDPHTRQRAPLAHSQGMEEEVGPPTQQRAQPARRQGIGGANPTRKPTILAHSQVGGEEGSTPELHRAYPAQGMQERERGGPQDQEVECGAPPKKRALSAHGIQ